MKKLAVVTMLLAALAGNAMATALIGRSATVNKFLQAFGWANIGYNKTAMSYIWDDGKYETPASYVGTTTASCDVTLALGLPVSNHSDSIIPKPQRKRHGGACSENAVADACQAPV